MTQAEPPNHEQHPWDEVFSGKRLPNPHNASEQEADQLRQALLWRYAKQAPSTLTPEQAEAFYWYVNKLKQQRKQSQFKNGLLALVMLGVFSASVWLSYQHAHSIPSSVPIQTPASMQANSATPASPLSSQANIAPAPPTRIHIKPLGKLPEMLSIPAGQFVMGCSAGWDDVVGGCRDNEFPAHEVKIAAFELSKYETTVGQFKHFVEATHYLTTAEQNQQGCTIADPQRKGNWIIDKTRNWRNPGFAQTDHHPVVCMSWLDTQAYLKWLNQETQSHYRLPTEAEWEYAARAGKATAFFWGSQPSHAFANSLGVEGADKWEYTAPVGQFAGNSFGLHDMAGNVWEWLDSCWSDAYQPAAENTALADCQEHNVKVRRGGSWDNHPPSIRAAYRSSGSTLERSYLYGFRVAR